MYATELRVYKKKKKITFKAKNKITIYYGTIRVHQLVHNPPRKCTVSVFLTVNIQKYIFISLKLPSTVFIERKLILL